MTYSANESSRYSGQPVKLYRFVRLPQTGDKLVHAVNFGAYADTAALLADWTESDPHNFATWTLETPTVPLVSSKVLQLHVEGFIAGGWVASLSKTFGGFTPGATVRKVWSHYQHIYTDFDGGGQDNWHVASDTTVTADGSGNVTVTFNWTEGIDGTFGPTGYIQFDKLQIYEQAAGDAGTVYAFTSDGLSHTFRGDTYQPAIISDSGLEWGSSETAGGDVQVTLPRDHEVAMLVRGGLPIEPIACTIYRVHRPDIAAGTSYATPFVGQITKAVVKGANCVLTLSTARSLLDGKRPRVRCQKQCNWSLGDEYCGVNLNDYTYTEGAITAISGKTVTVSGLATAAGTDYTRFQFGFLVGPSGESCQIEKQDSTSGSDDVVLMAQPRTLEVGQSVTVHWGCDLSTGPTGCGRFGNIARFGGFPKLPTRNPYVGAGMQP